MKQNSSSSSSTSTSNKIKKKRKPKTPSTPASASSTSSSSSTGHGKKKKLRTKTPKPKTKSSSQNHISTEKQNSTHRQKGSVVNLTNEEDSSLAPKDLHEEEGLNPELIDKFQKMIDEGYKLYLFKDSEPPQHKSSKLRRLESHENVHDAKPKNKSDLDFDSQDFRHHTPKDLRFQQQNNRDLDTSKFNPVDEDMELSQVTREQYANIQSQYVEPTGGSISYDMDDFHDNTRENNDENNDNKNTLHNNYYNHSDHYSNNNSNTNNNQDEEEEEEGEEEEMEFMSGTQQVYRNFNNGRSVSQETKNLTDVISRDISGPDDGNQNGDDWESDDEF